MNDKLEGFLLAIVNQFILSNAILSDILLKNAVTEEDMELALTYKKQINDMTNMFTDLYKKEMNE